MPESYWTIKPGLEFTAAGVAGHVYRVKWFNKNITAIQKKGKGNPEILLCTETVLKLINDEKRKQ